MKENEPNPCCYYSLLAESALSSLHSCQGPNISYNDLWCLYNFDFNFINHLDLEDMRIGARKKIPAQLSQKTIYFPTSRHVAREK